eukprot:s806_g2.t1
MPDQFWRDVLDVLFAPKVPQLQIPAFIFNAHSAAGVFKGLAGNRKSPPPVTALEAQSLDAKTVDTIFSNFDVGGLVGQLVKRAKQGPGESFLEAAFWRRPEDGDDGRAGGAEGADARPVDDHPDAAPVESVASGPVDPSAVETVPFQFDVAFPFSDAEDEEPEEEEVQLAERNPDLDERIAYLEQLSRKNDPCSPKVAETVMDSPVASEKSLDIPLTQPSPPDRADSEEVPPSPVAFLTRDAQNDARKHDSPARKGRGRKRVKNTGDKEQEKKGKGKGNNGCQPAKRARGRKAKAAEEEGESEERVEPSKAAAPAKAKASAKAKAKAKSAPKSKASAKRKAKNLSVGDDRVDGGETASAPSSSSASPRTAPAEAAAPLQTPSPKPRATKPRKSTPAKHPLIDRDLLKKEIQEFGHSTVVPYWSRPAVGLKVNKNRPDEKPSQAWWFPFGCCTL